MNVTPETSTPETEHAGHRIVPCGNRGRPPGDPTAAPLTVTYRIDEGPQMRVGTVRIEGNTRMNNGMLMPLLNTAPGQLLSPQNLAGDRDALLTQYLSRGFDQVSVSVTQQPEPKDDHKVNVVFHHHEGRQIFVRNVLLTGIHYTRMQTVQPAITIHAGDPLNQTALEDTQRNLYQFALFNEVNTAVENPDGAEPYKTVLLQAIEARRWTLTYGFGFEAQTGQPQNNCAGRHCRRRCLQSQRQNRRQPARAGQHHPQQSLRPRAVGLAPRHLRPAGAEHRAALPDSALSRTRRIWA